ncbi:MAG: hypothetical protein IIB44_03475 [Candidatus Marinimicrobia bacterium]|nr:hypothetical protein [Candidatus Neomarinimicrobiota bacterium]
MKSHSFFILVLLLLVGLPEIVFSCPYCVGQGGEIYIQQIIVPIAGLLLAPFLVFGIIALFIKKYSVDNNQS